MLAYFLFSLKSILIVHLIILSFCKGNLIPVFSPYHIQY